MISESIRGTVELIRQPFNQSCGVEHCRTDPIYHNNGINKGKAQFGCTCTVTEYYYC